MALVPLKRWAWTLMAKSSRKELIINYCLSLDSQASKGINGPKIPLWNGEKKMDLWLKNVEVKNSLVDIVSSKSAQVSEGRPYLQNK